MSESVKPKFVTCKFTGLHGTKLCGRLNREYVYQYSLRGIAQCGDIIVNYTQPYDTEIHVPYFEKEGIKNVIDVEYDLTRSPYHARVDAIKDLHPIYHTDVGWTHRNSEIMLSKFHWVEEQLQKIDADDMLYWIDCGLSHGGIIAQSFNPLSKDAQYYRDEKPSEMKQEPSHRNDLIFNKDFSKRLDAYAGDKVMLVCANADPHGDGLEYDNHVRQWPCGGLWGGKRRMLEPFIARFKELADEILATNKLVKEESIMAVILNEHEDWFRHDFTFATWYHPDWNVNQSGNIVYNTDLISFCSFFDMLNQIKID